MPAKNTIKLDVAESYYHVYARGVAKQPIFLDEDDYSYFRMLFARHLSLTATKSRANVAYPQFRNDIELVAYCQMLNHFHLLVYQNGQGALPSFMRSVMTAYSKYFNAKYKRTGPVFESRYKAARVDSNEYLLHISRYIHMNPRHYRNYKHSSYKDYASGLQSEWLQPERILSLFTSPRKYEEFCADYTDRREVLAKVKHELADY
jgi:putative transposase